MRERVSGFVFPVSGVWCRVSGVGFRVSGFRFRVPRFGFRQCGPVPAVSVRVSVLGLWADVVIPPVPAAPPSRVRGMRCRTSMAHTRQSRPDSGLGFQVKVLKTFQVVPSSLGSGTV